MIWLLFFESLSGLFILSLPAALLHGHVHPYGARVRPGRLGGTVVYNVTGWHLLEISPALGGSVTELLPGAPGRGYRDAR